MKTHLKIDTMVFCFVSHNNQQLEEVPLDWWIMRQVQIQ